ncbi:MAG: glycosyltransferase family 4 protein [Patescibacteria group bacterium]
MKVGIDGGALSISDDRLKVGVYRVAYNLVKELPRFAAANDYRVYSFKRGEEGSASLIRKNVSFVGLPRHGFQKIWQPIELIKHPVEVYLGISQALPLTLYDVRKIGFIYDVGFMDQPEFYRESYFALSRQTADVVRRADHIITISHASAASIRKHYKVRPEKLTVAYLGVEKQFHPTGPVFKGTNPYFLFVGSLKPGKNVPMMLRSFADFLKSSKTPYDFILAGSDYWLDPGISATINALGIRDRVHTIGFVDDETLSQYYRGATAFVSVSLIEGFGLPVVEAMATGTPVIGSTAGSYPEVVENAGLLVDPEDDAALTRAMIRIATQKDLRHTLAHMGKTRAKQFTWSGFAQSVASVF